MADTDSTIKLFDQGDSTLKTIRLVNNGDSTYSLATVGPTTTKSCTIANGAALSDEIDLDGFQSFIFCIPASWTSAKLAFKVAPATAGLFEPLYDVGGTLIEITVASSTKVTLTGNNARALMAARFVKLWSENAGADANQAGAKVITVIVKG